jgi:hypothetical protein
MLDKAITVLFPGSCGGFRDGRLFDIAFKCRLEVIDFVRL